jgi:hypothetical protein
MSPTPPESIDVIKIRSSIDVGVSRIQTHLYQIETRLHRLSLEIAVAAALLWIAILLSMVGLLAPLLFGSRQ